MSKGLGHSLPDPKSMPPTHRARRCKNGRSIGLQAGG